MVAAVRLVVVLLEPGCVHAGTGRRQPLQCPGLRGDAELPHHCLPRIAVLYKVVQ